MKVVTSRAVRKGEELCDNYGSSWGGGQRLRIIIIKIMIGGQQLRERRKALSADYGFTCTCVACAAEEKEESQEESEAVIESTEETTDQETTNATEESGKDTTEEATAEEEAAPEEETREATEAVEETETEVEEPKAE